MNKLCIVCKRAFKAVLEDQERCSKLCCTMSGDVGKEEYQRVSKELDRIFQEALRNSGFCKETTARWEHGETSA